MIAGRWTKKWNKNTKNDYIATGVVFKHNSWETVSLQMDKIDLAVWVGWGRKEEQHILFLPNVIAATQLSRCLAFLRKQESKTCC